MRTLLSVLLLLTGLLAMPRAASASWEMCNHTSYIAEVATSIVEQDKRITEGWKRIRPGECRALKEGELEPGEYRFYARSSVAHGGGIQRWNGRVNGCVDDSDFSIAGEADCEEVGFQTRGFLSIMIDRPSWRTTLTEPAEYDRTQARTAGLQRLLRDNGYGIRNVDGFAGRNTIRLGRAFLKENDLPFDTSEADIIDRLETAARRKRAPQGLTVCNRTDGMVWGAVAHQKDGDWESRGWWQLGERDCLKLIGEPLQAANYYLFASRENEDGSEAKINEAERSFCIGETRFSILRHDNCDERGLLSERFRLIANDGRDGRTIDLTERDFARRGLALR